MEEMQTMQEMQDASAQIVARNTPNADALTRFYRFHCKTRVLAACACTTLGAALVCAIVDIATHAISAYWIGACAGVSIACSALWLIVTAYIRRVVRKYLRTDADTEHRISFGDTIRVRIASPGYLPCETQTEYGNVRRLYVRRDDLYLYCKDRSVLPIERSGLEQGACDRICARIAERCGTKTLRPRKIARKFR